MLSQYFNKEKARDSLMRLIGGDVFSRGRAYFKEGLVGHLALAPSRSGGVKIRGRVFGTDEYQSHIIFNLKKNSFEDSGCSCPYNFGDCKHSAAMGLKFLNLYEEFCQSGIGGDDTIEYQQEMLDWIKSSKLNKTQDWEGEYYDDQESEVDFEASEMKMKATPKKSDFKNNKIGDANPTEIANMKERLKSIGIDPKKIPEFIMKELAKKNDESDKEIGRQARLYSGAQLEELGDFVARKYCLVLKTDYLPRIEIQEKNKPDATYWALQPDRLLHQEKSRLTTKQKELFAYLSGIESWYDGEEIDWGILFGLIKDSELSIFLDKKIIRNKLKLNDNPPKIEAGLSIRKDQDFPRGEMFPSGDIVFSLKGKLLEKQDVKIYTGTDAMVVLNDFQLDIFPLPLILSDIISRVLKNVREYHHGYDQRQKLMEWEARLNDKEIISINEIIKGASEAFKFENKLPKQFKINKFEIIGPTMLIDYDSAESTLELHAAIDYGFIRIDVSKTVYRSMRGGRASFQSRYISGRERYHLEIKGSVINYAEIYAEDEIALYEKFSEDGTYGFSKTLRCVRKGAKLISDFHENYWPRIKSLGFPIQYSRDEFDFVEENFKADFNVDFNDANDWFEFDVSCYCGENKITLEDLKKFVENKEQFIKMADGRIAKITNRAELEKFVLMLESFYQKETQKFQAKIYHAPELEDIISGSQYYESKISNSFKKFMDEAQSGKPVEKVNVPEKIKKPLRDYQKEGIDWFYFLRKYHFGGILADDMGLGKTLQALSLIEMNKVEGKPSLVICPKTLLFNWEDEAMKFFPKMKTLVIDGTPPERRKKLDDAVKYDLVIASYPSVKKDQEHYDRLKFNYCLIDEAQYIKNHKTLSARSVKKIHADYRLALTGTPLENSVSEIWSFFDFLMPGFLGTHSVFNERFEKPIMKNSDADALEALKKKISCFMLRRTKEKVLKELPPKIEQVSHCQLGTEQNILYQEILANVKSTIFETVQEKGFAKSQIHILAGLTKLRQVCNHPVLLLKDNEHEKYSSAKLELFLELVGEIVAGGKKVLVFSQFTQMLDILAKELEKQGISYHYLSGKTNNRKELVRDFNSNAKIPVFLISLKAGGTGLNLVSADNVIIFDPWWNPSVENQAIDRAHRIGQKNSVNVYRLIVRGTIEEKIVQLQDKKKFLFDSMVGESNDLFKKLTWTDVKELFD